VTLLWCLHLTGKVEKWKSNGCWSIVLDFNGMDGSGGGEWMANGSGKKNNLNAM